MTYIYGLLPPENWQKQIVNEDAEFQIGELGGFTVIRRHASQSQNAPYTEKEMADKVIAEMKNKGDATVTYIYVKVTRYASPVIGLFSYEYDITCVFKGSPIAWYVVVGILIGLSLILIVVTPIIWKYAGLSPEEVAKYLGEFMDAFKGFMEPFIIIAIIFVVGMFILFGGSITKKGITSKGR